MFVIVLSALLLAFTNKTTEDSGAAGVAAPLAALPSAELVARASAPERCPTVRKALRFYRGKYHSHRAKMGAREVRGLSTDITIHACPRVRDMVHIWKTRAYVARMTAESVLVIRAARKRKARVARERRQLYEKWRCIHEHEGAWDSNTGNGYYGGLQMDMGFQSTYGSEFMSKWGTANNWPVWAQITAAERAYHGYNGYGGRGFGPWPNTSRMCGLR